MFVVPVRSIVAIAALIASCSLSVADENKLYIVQDSTLAGPVGNTLFVDQSSSQGSTVMGVPDDATLITASPSALDPATLPAVQIGSGNDADINLSGALSLGMLSQTGNGNAAIIDVSGNRSIGAVRQTGNRNTGEVNVAGDDLTGVLIQNGHGNSQTLNVTNANVTWTQNGNNITQGDASTFGNPSVVSNGATVIVTQTR